MAGEMSRALDELLRKSQMSEDVDFLREGVRTLAQALMEAEVAQHVGASRYERTPARTGERNGSYFPSLLEPRRRAERALVAVVHEAYVQGVSPRRVEEWVQALGLSGISKSQVSLVCQELDAEVEAFRTRPLGEADYPSVTSGWIWLDLAGCDLRQSASVRAGLGARGKRW